ncbi:MAG: VOC family protein [Actinomycetales bacterium]|nr:VOC family protein [Actinomycetales bacterium]
MTTPFAPGTPCWADLSPTDMDVARAFYADVLGWDIPPGTDAFGGYTTASINAAGVAGLMPNDGTVPTAWTLYLASTDAAATQSAIEAAGGTVLVPADAVGEFGRMVIAMDPTGAVFGVWEAASMVGFEVVGAPGGFAWCDLRSSDPDRAREFYASVFGYEYEAMPMASEDYTTFSVGESPLGGVGGMMGAPEGTPSHWLVYFAVQDADAAVDAVTELGGTSLAPPFDTPFGRMAPITDPFGAPLWLVQLP